MPDWEPEGRDNGASEGQGEVVEAEKIPEVVY
jgi:hypothetical protein